MTSLTVTRESWPIQGSFTISRGSKTAAEVIVAQIEKDGVRGRGECVPYRRYGETVDGVFGQISALKDDIRLGLDRQQLQSALSSGAARNALDCAFWDLESKLSGTPVWQLAGLPPPTPLTTAYTLSLGDPDQMAAAAETAVEAGQSLLKLKLGGDGDLERVTAVRDAVPGSRLIADANEAWTVRHLNDFGQEFKRLRVELIEQPLPADADQALEDYVSPVPLCADESCHDVASLAGAIGKYDIINLKLDKAGGFTEALRLLQAARQADIGVMVGCMVATSLAMAPAVLLGVQASYVDLDGPLLLARDREPALEYTNDTVSPPQPQLWG